MLKTIYQHKAHVISNIIAIIALAILTILSIITSFPASASTNVDFSITLAPSLQVSIPSTPVVLSLNPQIGHAVFSSADLTISIGTNNPTGYTLQVTESSGNGKTALTRTTENASGTYPTIATLASDNNGIGYTENQFTASAANQWGYKITGGNHQTANYFPFPDTSSNPLILNETTTPTNAEDITMTFGAAVDMLQEAGTYEITLNYELIPNSNVPSLSALTTMQDAANYTAGDVCNATKTGTEATLTDTRDSKSYTVKKLEDGKCWMMENLKLDGEVELTKTNTNFASDYSLSDNQYFNSATLSVLLPENVSGGDADFQTTGYTTAKIVAQTGSDAAGNYGNLYNYCAVSAGTYCMDKNSGSGDATSDICPAGWRLPTGGTDMETGGEFLKLLAAYNGGKGDIDIYNDSSDPTGVAMFVVLENMLKVPLAGAFTNSAPANQGSNGGYWSSTFFVAANMRTLHFNNTTATVVPRGNNYRYYGRSVRCVLK